MKKNLLLICTVFLLANYSYLQAQTFVGSEACKDCHSGKFNDWVESGHPYKFILFLAREPFDMDL